MSTLRFRGLYWRIALASVTLVTLILMAQAVTFIWLFQTNRSNELQQQAFPWTRAISSELSESLRTSPDLNIAQRLAQIDVTRRVFVILRSGTVIGAPPDVAVDTVSPGWGAVPDTGPIPRVWERSAYAGAPLYQDGKVIGVVGMTPLSSLERFGPLLGAIALFIMIAAIVLYSFAVVRPVRRSLLNLQTVAKRLGSGDLTARAAVEGADEVADVGRAFNAMADQLEIHTTALETSDRLRTQLVADVSHELMTPLTAVLGHLETLDMPDIHLDESERRKQVAIATREAHRLKRVIADLLNAARHEAGSVELNYEDIDPRRLLDQIVARHSAECASRGIQLSAVIAADVECVEADPFRIEQAIDNVIANAMRHTQAGGRIDVRLMNGGDAVIFEVEDSGEGIPAEHLPHIFDRFYKAASASGLASPGSGLGLSIVKAIVQGHNGQITALSQPGAGTTIRMTLPLVPTIPATELNRARSFLRKGPGRPDQATQL